MPSLNIHACLHSLSFAKLDSHTNWCTRLSSHSVSDLSNSCNCFNVTPTPNIQNSISITTSSINDFTHGKKEKKSLKSRVFTFGIHPH